MCSACATLGHRTASPWALLDDPPTPCPQVNFLLLTSVGVLLPMRLHLPLHLAFLLLMLRASALRCREECSMLHAAAAAASGAPPYQLYYAPVVQWLRRVNPRTLWRLPPSWRPGGSSAGACLGPCFAVHAFLQVCGRAGGRMDTAKFGLAQSLWPPCAPALASLSAPVGQSPSITLTAAPCLQSVIGVLMPLAMLWVWEERLRAREIRSWRHALAQQEQHAAEQRLQQEREQGAQQRQQEPSLQGSERGEGSRQQLRRRRGQPEGGPEPGGSPETPQGSPAGPGSPVWRERSPPPLPQDLPLPVASTAAWFVLSAWLIWQLLEAALL